MNENTTVAQVAPTQAQAIQEAQHEAFTDTETVALVQRLLLSKGYVDGGPATGVLGQKTKDEILTFRARNNLQLIPVIDRDLIKALELAPNKSVPIEQATATKAEVAAKVEIVADTNKVQKTAWWQKLWAWITGAPAATIAVAGYALENVDEATEAVAPLKQLLYDFQGISPFVWLLVIAAIAGVMGYQAMTIARLSKKVEDNAVEGYQRGTLKNDLPPAEQQL